MSARETTVRYVCPVCAKTFDGRQARNQHKALRHAAELQPMRGHLDRQQSRASASMTMILSKCVTVEDSKEVCLTPKNSVI